MSVRPRSSASKSNRRGSRPRRLPAHCFRLYRRLYHRLRRCGHTRTFTGASRPSRKSMSAVPSSLACYMHSYRQYRVPSRTPVAAQRVLDIAMARAKSRCTLQWLSSSGPSCSTKMFGQSGSTLTRCWSRPWRSQLRKQTHMSLRHIGQHIHTQTAQRRLADSHGCVCWDGWRRGQRHLIDGGRGGRCSMATAAAWVGRNADTWELASGRSWRCDRAWMGHDRERRAIRCSQVPSASAVWRCFWLCLQVDGKLASSAGVMRWLNAGKSRCL